MKTILVPTDFSDHALFALKVAANTAKKIKAEIILVHNYSMPSEGFENAYYYKDMQKEIKAFINKQFTNLLNESFLKDINISTFNIANCKASDLVHDVRFKDADLIVMGSHGKDKSNDIFIGSYTEKIVRLADAPVLTIKNNIDNFKIDKMVFASNFFNESYSVFKKIKFFADLYNAHIELLKVITPKDFEATPISLKLMEDFANKFQLPNYTINTFNASSIEKGITDFSNEIRADLIAIETHGRTGIAHLINGSLAEDVAKHESKPVLSVKIKDIPVNISGLRWYQQHMEKLESEHLSKPKGSKNEHIPNLTTI